MAIVSKTTLKGYFESGDKPTQSQFVDLIDTLMSQYSGDIPLLDSISLNTGLLNSSGATVIDAAAPVPAFHGVSDKANLLAGGALLQGAGVLAPATTSAYYYNLAVPGPAFILATLRFVATAGGTPGVMPALTDVGGYIADIYGVRVSALFTASQMLFNGARSEVTILYYLPSTQAVRIYATGQSPSNSIVLDKVDYLIFSV